MQFQNAKDDAAVMPWLKVFLYGATGAGKTLQASMFPEPLMLFPAVEGSITTVRGQDVPYKAISSSKDMIDVLRYLNDVQTRQGAEKLPASTLVLESMSHYCDMIAGEEAAKRPRGMDQQGWGAVKTHFQLITGLLANLQMHVIYTSLAAEPALEENRQGGPLISGASKTLVPATCDAIIFMEQSGTPPKHTAHLTTWRNYMARHRFRSLNLPDSMIIGNDPNTNSLWCQLCAYLAPKK